MCTHTCEWGRWGWWGWGCVCWWVVSSIRYPAPRSIPLHFSCRPPTNMGSANSYQQNGSLSIFSSIMQIWRKHKCKEKFWEWKKFVRYAEKGIAGYVSRVTYTFITAFKNISLLLLFLISLWSYVPRQNQLGRNAKWGKVVLLVCSNCTRCNFFQLPWLPQLPTFDFQVCWGIWLFQNCGECIAHSIGLLKPIIKWKHQAVEYNVQ